MRVKLFCGPLFALLVAGCLFCQADPAWAGRRRLASPFNGRIIRKIVIQVRPIFEGNDLNFIYRTANNLKIATHQKIVRRELLLKEGDRYDEFRVRESERRLRLLKYLRRVSIHAEPEGDDVNLIIDSQDTWTLIPQLNYSSGVGKDRKSVGVAETDFLGYGNRLELNYQQSEGRETVAGVFEDEHIFNSNQRLLAAYLQRSDGHQSYFYYGKPLRTLVDRTGWYANVETGDIVGRLFENGDVDYIFRQKNELFNLRYTISRGRPEVAVTRFSFGYDFNEYRFSRADSQDYSDLDLDPTVVSNAASRLPNDRRYSGPSLGYDYIVPNYISMNYIDRFDRVEDYNLGLEHDSTVLLAPDALGSFGNYALYSGDISRGIQFSRGAFLRGELGLSSRLSSRGFANTLARAELKFYDVLGDLCIGELFAGKHTLAANLLIDYGDRLDADRQLSLGGDNGLRGYAARAFNGDKLMVLNLEDRIHLVDDAYKLVSLGAAFFGDFGTASYDHLGQILAHEFYGDVGAGFRVAFPRSSGGQVLRLDFGLPLRSASDGSGAFEVRLIIAGGQLFNSKFRSETVGPEKANVTIGVDR